MAKRHWYTGLRGACKVPRTLLGWWYEIKPRAFLGRYALDPDRYCSDCAKTARLALAKESAPKPDAVVWPKPPTSALTHWGERSGLRYCNHAKIAAPCSPAEFLQMSDLCRKCERGARIRLGCAQPNPIRTDSDRYAELRQLVEEWQSHITGSSQALADWSHR